MRSIFINDRRRFYLLVLVLNAMSLGTLFGQRATIDKLKIELSEAVDDSTKTNILLKIGAAYRAIDIDSTLYFNKIALTSARENNLEELFNVATLNRGIAFYDKANYAEALSWLERALSLTQKKNDTLLLSIVSMQTGIVYHKMKESEKAMEFYQIALNHLSNMGHRGVRYIEILNNLGALYKDLNNLDKSMEYYEKSRQLAAEKQDTINVAVAMTNKASLYLSMGKVDTMLTVVDKINLLIESKEDSHLVPNIIGMCYNLKAAGHYAKKEYQKSINTAKMALAYRRKNQIKTNNTKLYWRIARASIDIKDYAMAINYAEKGLEDVNKLNKRGGELPFYQLLSEAYQAINQLPSALVMERKYSQLQDSLHQLEVEEKIANLEYTAEIKQKETENALLKEEQKNQALSLQQKNYAILFAILGLLLLGGILVQMYFSRNKLNQLNQKLTIQANKLKQNHLFKNRLFGNIAHELRTPLTLILGQLNLLAKETTVIPKLQQKVQITKNTSQGLLELTNQILDLTKSEVGLVKTTIFTFHLHDLLRYLQLQFNPIAQRKNIALQFITTEADIELATDTEKLIIILRNLLSNAVKYNQSAGNITLSYQDLETDFAIKVEDTGQGIPSADLSLIFDRYYQSQQTQTPEGGIGVGLAICKEYTQLLGGTIAVQSTLGKGSTFTVQLPKRLATTKEPIPAYEFPKYLDVVLPELPTLQAAETPVEEYILVVEDNLELAHYLYEILQADYEIFFAANGKEALQQIDLKAPLVIITDWMMPLMDGETLIKHLKQSETLASIPVLMLTARTDIKEQLGLLRIGLDDYLTKPFDAVILQTHLDRLIDKARQQLHVRKEDELMDQLETRLLAFDPKEQELLKQVKQIVLKNIACFDLTLEKISQIIGLSERHLSRKIKQLTTLTANQFVNEIRFREAKRMLIEREYTSVKAVVYSVGFKSEKIFSRNFKKRFGKYPKELLN